MRAFRVRRRVIIAAAAAVLLVGGGAIAYASAGILPGSDLALAAAPAVAVPNPDPCDSLWRNTWRGQRDYLDCRSDRIERAIPGATVPSPDTCDPMYAANHRGFRDYEDCRLTRIESKMPGATPTSTTSTTTQPTTTTTTSTTTQPTTTTSSSTTTATSSTTTTTTPPPVLNLPRVAWEGGADYYQQFPDAARNGWADPGHFPIGIWWGVFEADVQVKWDKAHGINTYLETNPSTQNTETLLSDNGMSWIGGQLPGMTRGSRPWVGDMLGDEVDGRFGYDAGIAEMQKVVAALPDHNKIRYANYTPQVVNVWFQESYAKRFVNDFTDTVSLDQYWYTAPFCNWEPYPAEYWITPVPKDTCRTAHSYGAMTDMLRSRDASDGKLQPVWQFIENVNQNNQYPITPERVKGAAWASLIHEARGLVWFNSSFDGACLAGNAIRHAQYTDSWACDPQIEAMGQVNNQIQRLAPVLNTQSYEWNAGPGVDTMLKAKDGFAYVFAATNGHAGQKSINLPAGLGGTAEVVDENRTVTVTGGNINDSFPDEASYHIYKVALT